MTEDRVTDETLQLASDKGIEWQPELLEEQDIPKEESQPNPTQAIFQKFLREKYDIHISVFNVDYWVQKRGDNYHKVDHDGRYEYSIKFRNLSVCSSMGSSGWPTSSKEEIQYPTYEEALEAALQRAISDLKLCK